MSSLFLVRNLMSLTSARAISKKLCKKKIIFSVVSGDNKLKRVIKNNIDDAVDVTDSEFIEFLPFKVSSLIKQRRIIDEVSKRIERFLLTENITQIFITYPLHVDSYLYYKISVRLGINVGFYEEGPCFYRQGRTRQYQINDFRTFFRKVYFSLIGLNFGYGFEPNSWYSSLPINGNCNIVKLSYRVVELPMGVHNVFLSRPMSNDYPTITIDDEINAIKIYISHIIGCESTLYIKFHPRESEEKIITLINRLTSIGIKVQEIKGDFSAEDLLFSMESGTICGYDSTTLVYSKSINEKVKAISLLSLVKDKDRSGFLKECHSEYMSLYPHIHMLEISDE
ncbi:hypothetical protein ABHV50_004171 [Vibrio vulnificus]